MASQGRVGEVGSAQLLPLLHAPRGIQCVPCLVIQRAYVSMQSTCAHFKELTWTAVWIQVKCRLMLLGVIGDGMCWRLATALAFCWHFQMSRILRNYNGYWYWREPGRRHAPQILPQHNTDSTSCELWWTLEKIIVEILVLPLFHK